MLQKRRNKPQIMLVACCAKMGCKPACIDPSMADYVVHLLKAPLPPARGERRQRSLSLLIRRQVRKPEVNPPRVAGARLQLARAKSAREGSNEVAETRSRRASNSRTMAPAASNPQDIAERKDMVEQLNSRIASLRCGQAYSHNCVGAPGLVGLVATMVAQLGWS